MELTVKTRQTKITERQRAHIDEKLSRLVRYLDILHSATVEVAAEQQRGAGEVFRVQVTLIGDRGVILRAEEQAGDIFAAIDQVSDVLQRQIKRYKEKHWRRGKLRRNGDRFTEANEGLVEMPVSAGGDDDESRERQITRTKEFVLRPMFTDDAVEQMELLGHTFFVFQDAETSRVSVLYRRRDGDYGLIVPTSV